METVKDFSKHFDVAKNDLFTIGVIIIAQQLMLLDEPAKRGSMNYYIKKAHGLVGKHQTEILALWYQQANHPNRSVFP